MEDDDNFDNYLTDVIRRTVGVSPYRIPNPILSRWGRQDAPETKGSNVTVRAAGGEHWGTDEEDELPETLRDLIQWAAGQLGQIPEEYRDTATIEFSSDYDRTCVEWTIRYTRPETDEEFADRAELHRQHRKQAIAEERDAELALLARLKAKYEEA